jgi:CheY-like chemotaxis protein
VSRPRVVCVDDDASIRRFVELALEDLPVELLTCADATTARELLRQGPVALLITDLMMPGESGFELLASLMADPALRGGALLAVFSAGLATVVFHHAADEERDPARHHRWRRGGSDPHFVLSTERYR